MSEKLNFDQYYIKVQPENIEFYVRLLESLYLINKDLSNIDRLKRLAELTQLSNNDSFVLVSWLGKAQLGLEHAEKGFRKHITLKEILNIHNQERISRSQAELGLKDILKSMGL